MSSNYIDCPKCGAADPKMVNFTWWGGVLGPKLLTHVKCLNCGNKYNGKSGKDNTANIALYFVAAGVAAFVVMFVGLAFLARF
ncbi:MAG: hypothetical protein ACKVQJ_03300 [Pyrinomonadaceae bacterium]